MEAILSDKNIITPSSSSSKLNSMNSMSESSSPSNTPTSGIQTPSFSPNSPSDHISPENVTISKLVEAISTSSSTTSDPHAPSSSPSSSSSRARHPSTVQEEIKQNGTSTANEGEGENGGNGNGLNDTVDNMVVEELDWNLPISQLLKIGTKRAHADAETSQGAKLLMRGELPLEDYIKWNVILWRVYDALELALTEHYDHPVLSSTYDPRTLSRSGPLSKDITYLLSLHSSLDPSSSSESPIPPSDLSSLSTSSVNTTSLPPFPLPSFLLPIFQTPPTPLQTYIDHIKHLASTEELATGLLAHSYVRYLGDMSGGQFVAARVKKAYKLGGGQDGLDGLRFYHFDQDLNAGDDDGKESRSDIKKKLIDIKDWFRKGMDQGVGNDTVLKPHLVKEANIAFALNTHLFSLLSPTSPTSPISSSLSSALPSSSNALTHRNPQSSASRPRRNQPPLRYYEIRELEKLRADKEKMKLIMEGKLPMEPKRSWRDLIERFLLAAIAILIGQFIVKVGLPLYQGKSIEEVRKSLGI